MVTTSPSTNNATIDLKEVPRHPDAAAAILVTGVHFGDITGAKPHSGIRKTYPSRSSGSSMDAAQG